MSRFTQPGRQPAEMRALGRRFGPVLAATLVLGVTAQAAAQSNSGIYINNDVLNNLGPGPQAAPLTPYTPSYAPSAPVAPLAPQSGAANKGLTFQTQGSGNFVVTRPGTLLFPPLEAPTSTLAPGFDSAANQAARQQAYSNAFAGGPEPTSQLLIPLDSGRGQDDGSIQIFADQLPPIDPSANQGKAPVLTLNRPPQPAAPKPQVPAQAIAAAQQAPAEAANAGLAPEFQSPEPPVMAEVPAMAKVEEAPIAPAPVQANPVQDAPASVSEAPDMNAATPEAATPELALAEALAADPPSTPASAPLSSAEVAAPVTVPATPAATQAASAPVSLLPATAEAAAPPAAQDHSPSQPAANLAAEPASGVQTASLTVAAPSQDVSFVFEAESAELSELAQSELRSLADSLRSSSESRVQVLGFASADGSTEDMARKLALSRALKVRTFLIEAGVPSTRIQVRSLGDKADGGPANRVDIRPIDS